MHKNITLIFIDFYIKLYIGLLLIGLRIKVIKLCIELDRQTKLSKNIYKKISLILTLF